MKLYYYINCRIQYHATYSRTFLDLNELDF